MVPKPLSGSTHSQTDTSFFFNINGVEYVATTESRIIKANSIMVENASLELELFRCDTLSSILASELMAADSLVAVQARQIASVTLTSQSYEGLSELYRAEFDRSEKEKKDIIKERWVERIISILLIIAALMI